MSYTSIVTAQAVSSNNSTFQNNNNNTVYSTAATTTATAFRHGDSESPAHLQRALVLLSKSGHYTLVHCFARPRPGPSEVLVRNVSIGLNPVDWKCLAYGFGIHSLPWINGRESCGIVEAVGEGVTEFSEGDRVIVASTNYRDNRTSTFQEFSVAAAANCALLPEAMSFDEGATFGVGFVAAAEALFNSLGLPWPELLDHPTKKLHKDEPPLPEKKRWILIWGGATTTGLMAIQLAIQMGLSVIAVSSLHNADYLRSYGAEVVLCRHGTAETIQEVRKYDVDIAIDCVGGATAGFAAQALKEGGRLVCLVQRPKSLDDERRVELLDVLLKRFHEDLVYGRRLMVLAERLLKDGKLRAPRVKIVSGGLAGVEMGLDWLRKNEVSGAKLVVRMLDTPP